MTIVGTCSGDHKTCRSILPRILDQKQTPNEYLIVFVSQNSLQPQSLKICRDLSQANWPIGLDKSIQVCASQLVTTPGKPWMEK